MPYILVTDEEVRNSARLADEERLSVREASAEMDYRCVIFDPIANLKKKPVVLLRWSFLSDRRLSPHVGSTADRYCLTGDVCAGIGCKKNGDAL